MKNKFIKATFILIVGGAITKIMAMVIKIILTRVIGESGIGMYMLIMPTFNLFITLATLSLPISISKVIATGTRAKKVIIPIIPIVIIYNFGLLILLFFLAPFIASKLLNSASLTYAIRGIGYTLPFIALSSILKGYYYGKERMNIYVISNILEQIVRLFLIWIIIPRVRNNGIDITIMWVVIVNIFSELSSIVMLIGCISNKKIKIDKYKLDKEIFKDILNVSLSSTGSRLVGSIAYFVEPIILTYVLTRYGYKMDYITMEYGIITGYVFPLLLLPSFFSMAISTSLLPIISSNYAKGRFDYNRKKLKEAVILSFIIGVVSIIGFVLFGRELFKLIYNTNKGYNYLVIIAPLFVFHYIQGPLTSYMQGSNMARKAFKGTLYGAIVKTVLLIILPRYFGVWGFIVANISNIIIVTGHHLYYICKKY